MLHLIIDVPPSPATRQAEQALVDVLLRSQPQLNRDGVQMKGPDGRGLWVPVVGFASRGLRDKFSAAVIDALLASHPDALL